MDEGRFVGRLATGTFRRLPARVRSDWELAEALIEYFKSAWKLGGYRPARVPNFRDRVESSEDLFGDEKKDFGSFFRVKCEELGDYELDCFSVLAITTALRTGSLLPRRWSRRAQC